VKNAFRHTKLLVAALLAALAAVPAAGAAPAALQQATSNCWLQVINDWLDNSQVDNTYAVPCYTQAIQHLNQYPDLKGYSSAVDDIQRAQLAAIRQDRSTGGPGSGSDSSTGHSGTPGPGGSSNGPGGNSPGGHSGGILGVTGPSDATSIPLPLIVLGALAVLLALAALATWLARRFQTRRPATAPAVPPRR
jgi:hypothetical protein